MDELNEDNLEEIYKLLENLTYEDITEYIENRNREDSGRTLQTYLISSLYGLIVLISFFGNLLVVFVCVKNMTKTNALLLSLSSSDLLMTVFNIPFNVVRLLKDDWPFGRALCISVPFVQVMVVYVSSFTMAVIAIHRWLCIRSLSNRSDSSKWPIVLTIVITWCLAALMSFPPSLYNDIAVLKGYREVVRCRPVYPEDSKYSVQLILSVEIFVTQYLVPLSMSAVYYVKIGRVVYRQGKIINLRGNIEAKRRQRHKRRRIIMLVLVVAVFATCWLPLNIYHLLVDANAVPYNYRIFITCHWFAMSSVCYNPFIYCWLNKKFRKSAKRLFSYLLCRCRPLVADNRQPLATNNNNNSPTDNYRQTIEMNVNF